MTNNKAIGILAIVVETAKGRCFVTDEAISDAYDMAIKALEAQELSKNSPKLDKENGDSQPTCNQLATDTISRQAAIDLAEEVETKRLKGEIDLTYAPMVKGLTQLPSAQPTLCGYDIEHLILIAHVLRKENLPPERITEVITDIGRIVSIVRDEFTEKLLKAVEQCEI